MNYGRLGTKYGIPQAMQRLREHGNTHQEHDNADHQHKRFEVPAMHQTAQQYCQRHPAGRYGQRYQQALQKALAAEAQK